MNSRERIQTALNHQEPDKIPLDVGAGFQTGLHVQMVYKLRQALELDPPGTPVKIISHQIITIYSDSFGLKLQKLPLERFVFMATFARHGG